MDGVNLFSLMERFVKSFQGRDSSLSPENDFLSEIRAFFNDGFVKNKACQKAKIFQSGHSPRNSESEEELLKGRSHSTIQAGGWETVITLNGNMLIPRGKWSLLCEDYEPARGYSEWSLPLTRHYRLERQILLAFCEKVFWVADTLIPEKPVRPGYLCYESRFPWGGTVVKPEDPDANELVFMSGDSAEKSRKVRVLPIGLPEWKTESEGGLLQDSGSLVLRQDKTGTALFAPLFFDFDSARANRACTWRHLTVGERLAPVSSDIAVGYRVQLGAIHYLIYRSLAPSANRTVLGHNLLSEFLFARFSHAENVTPIVEIENHTEEQCS